MGAAEVQEMEGEETPHGADRHETLSVAPQVVEVRRHGGVAALVGITSAVVAIAYLARASQSGAVLDWTLAVVMGGLAAYWLASLVDARTPLLIADAQGIRMRLGRAWQGLPWTAVHHVEHLPRRGWWRDGRLVVVPHNLELVESGLTRGGRRQVALARALHGAPFAVPLGLSTRVVGAEGDLSEALERVAREVSQIVVVDPEPFVEKPEESAPEAVATQEAGPIGDDALVDDAPDDGGANNATVVDWAEESAPLRPSATPLPLRQAVTGRRSEVHRTIEESSDDEDARQGRELRRPGSISLVEETQEWGERVRPIARAGEPVAPIVLDDFAVEPVAEPVVGPEITAARTRLGLSVDQLAERTRIRPHVIEAVEVDDFEPCGGDFYARGHLRTLSRVLGIDADQLLAHYDERYARAPINPRSVFEAELATGSNGSIRGTRGGPNWSVLVAVVMALVLCWSVARLVMDTPPSLRTTTPVLNGSGGPEGSGGAVLADPVDIVVKAPTGGARVVVRDASGEIVFAGNLAVGQQRELEASPPIRVQSSDGSVTVAVAGADARPVGEPGVAGQGTFVEK